MILSESWRRPPRLLPLSEGGVLAQLAEHDLTEASNAATVALEIFLLVTYHSIVGIRYKYI